MSTNISRRTLVAGIGAGIAATAVGVAAAPAASAGDTSTKPALVLVHGGFADATNSWEAVIGQLQRRGYTVMAEPTRCAASRPTRPTSPPY